MRTILGIDPGLTRCGIGVVAVRGGRKVSLRHVTCARTSPDTPLPARLTAIGDAVEQALDEYQPASVALERVFAQANVKSVMSVAQISGVVMVAAERRGVPVELITPSEAKAAVTGYGAADKRQVGEMVRRILGLAEVPKPADAADALALAICAAWKSPIASLARTTGDTRAASVAVSPHPRLAKPATAAGETPAQIAWRAAEQRARGRR